MSSLFIRFAFLIHKAGEVMLKNLTVNSSLHFKQQSNSYKAFTLQTHLIAARIALN